ncbi:MAG: DUF115 domain-containing protein [Deltaproteobacteria bacterium]|nr:DUF115 domain-containing protein [Deltaproteobacteria bacterium]
MLGRRRPAVHNIEQMTAFLRLAETLEKLADRLDEACAAIDAGQRAQVFELLQQSAARKAEIAELQAHRSRPKPGEQQALAPRVRAATARIARANDMLERFQQAEQAAEQWLSASHWNIERDILILVGDGALLDCRALIARGQKRIFVLGDQQVADWPTGAQRVASLRELIDRLQLLEPPFPSHATTRAASGAQLPTGQCEQISAAVDQCLRSRKTRDRTVAGFGEHWVTQGLSNLDALARLPSMTVTKDAFFDVPCVLVGPGPSLENNISQLARYRDRFVLVAYQRTLAALSAAGIDADVAVVLDAQPVVYDHVKDYAVERLAALLLAATCDPRFFSLPAPTSFAFFGNGASDDWLRQMVGDDSTHFFPGGSVACAAFEIALYWGCAPLILVGQDLAFGGEKLYATSAFGGQASRMKAGADQATYSAEQVDGAQRRSAEGLPLCRLPGYYGGEVLTSASMAGFHRWFETAALDIAAAERRIPLYNCTEGGANIAGFANRPLADVLAALPSLEIDVKRVFAERAASADLPKRRSTIELTRAGALIACQRAQSLAQRCLELAERNALAELANLENQLIAALRELPMLSLMRQGPIRQALAQIDDHQRAATLLYRVVLEAMPLLLRYLQSRDRPE